MIPWVLNDPNWNFGDSTDVSFDLNPIDHSASGADNDPYTDWVYWRNPQDTSPGTTGYDQFVADVAASTYDFASPEVLARTVLINRNGGDVSDSSLTNVNQLLPEVGTVFRILSVKPQASTTLTSVSLYTAVGTTFSFEPDVDGYPFPTVSLI